MNIIKRFVRSIRSKRSRRTHKKTNKKQNHKGGAIYSFDLNDKIGGLPANVALNRTQDGDCPNSDTTDLGFTNYGMTRMNNVKGGSYKKNNKNKKSMKKSMKHKKSKTSKKYKGNFRK